MQRCGASSFGQAVSRSRPANSRSIRRNIAKTNFRSLYIGHNVSPFFFLCAAALQLCTTVITCELCFVTDVAGGDTSTQIICDNFATYKNPGVRKKWKHKVQNRCSVYFFFNDFCYNTEPTVTQFCGGSRLGA